MTDRKGASAPGFPTDIRDSQPPSFWKARADQFAAYAQASTNNRDKIDADIWFHFSAEMHTLANTTTKRESGDG